MSTYPCASCGREINAAPHCPHCGAPQGRWAEELARIDRSIAEMKKREAALGSEAKQIAADMQAALFQRDILAHASAERLKQATRPRRVLRRRVDPQRPPAAEPGQRPRVPRQGPPPATAGRDRPPPPPPRTRVTPPPGREPAPRPEASTREVQNILLGLGALLLGVAAVVFAAVAISSFGSGSRLAILLAATAGMLAAPPVMARRGLTATAETIAAVGLLLVPLDGYALWTVEQVRGGVVSGAVFASIVFGVTAVVAGAYAGLTGLNVPRYVTVLALQPILPLLAYDWISAPIGWALALVAVAAVDLYLARLFDQHGRLAPPAWLARQPGEPAAGAAGPDPADVERPESAHEEADAVLRGDESGPTRAGAGPDDLDRLDDLDGPGPARTGTRSAGSAGTGTGATAPPILWLRELTWALHGLAIAGALVYAVAALLDATTAPTAFRAGITLLLAAGIGLAGALSLGRPALVDLAAGVLTLAVIGAAGRVVAVTAPGEALLLVALVIALTGFGVRAVPEAARRGPQLASAVALAVSGVVVAGGALRAGLAPVRAAMPVWQADLAAYPERLAAAAGPAGWQLAATAFLLTVAAVLALPPEVRREGAVVGAALTALAVPASFGLSWVAAPWPPLLVAAGIALAGLTARTTQTAVVHVVAAAVLGLAAAGAGMARPGLTAAVLLGLTVAGALVAAAPVPSAVPVGESAPLVAAYAAGGAAFALPGAVAAFVASTVPVDPTPTAASLQHATQPVLAASFLAVCATLGYAAVTQVSQRQVAMPLAVGTGLGVLAVTAAAFGAAGATAPDAWVGTLLLVAAVLLVLAPSIDAGRRADRVLDGSDLAAAAATTALVATLARIAAILAPNAQLVAGAVLVLVVAAGARALPDDWRRGPVLGIALGGGVIALLAGWTALSGGVRVLASPGRLWEAQLGEWPAGPAGTGTWQAPVALVLLAAAAAIVLPRPWRYDVAAVCVGLATIGTPAALGLPWWSPVLVGGAVATAYGVSAVAAADPRAGLTRAAVAAVVALHAVGASLVRPWTTAVALTLVVLLGVVVAVLARTVAGLAAGEPVPEFDGDEAVEGGTAVAVEADEMPPHLVQIGGCALAGALIALPGALAALSAELGGSAETVLVGGLAASSLGVAALALARRRIPHFLPYASVGIAVGATVTAAASIFTGLPFGVYAAAAALLGILAELIRSATTPPGTDDRPARRWTVMLGGALRRIPGGPAREQWSVSPAAGAMAAAALPVALAVAAIAPALVAALVEPYRTLGGIWDGPPPGLTTPPAKAVGASNVLAALLLTIAAALAATGFTGGRPARAIPVVLPGAAVTLLIAPIALGQGWPNSTMAALMVFTLAMLGLALTPPPPVEEPARSLRVARVVAFVIGLAAGGAGLAGSLATREMTLFTLGSAVGVGAVAALAGRSQPARILGWLFASVMGQLFVLTAGLVAGLDPGWSAFGVLAVGAALLLVAATLPRLRRPEASREAATVEWSGYGAALIAGALAFDSPRHIAALLAAWGAVLGVAATRPGRRTAERRTLFWAAVGCEITAWWLLMAIADVALPEAYTLPFAALALLVGLLELRHRPDLSSWTAYGPALVAAFLPSLVLVIASSNTSDLRQVLLLLGGVATLIFGSMRRQQAPVITGAVVTALATLHLLTAFGPWLVLIPVGIVLLLLGASNERRRRTQERLRGALRGMR
ncbi:permease [Micromonospora sp. NPDC049559]|uniref:SCO7613 C-terminal domain-containing membrane protein n=1 Tax=Micromonospora sp. NPDC049559 TaxID=3155923 RepID=UPI003441F8B9